MLFFFFFFFSSRRRHTRWTGDWSSDVCSSDLLKRRSRRSSLCRTTSRSARSPLQATCISRLPFHTSVEESRKLKAAPPWRAAEPIAPSQNQSRRREKLRIRSRGGHEIENLPPLVTELACFVACASSPDRRIRSPLLARGLRPAGFFCRAIKITARNRAPHLMVREPCLLLSRASNSTGSRQLRCRSRDRYLPLALLTA